MSEIADIYISHSAEDNTQTGWVDHLKGFLELFLKNLIGREIEIILDEDGSKKPTAHTFIFIVSSNHLDAESSISKLNEFSKKSDNTETVFKVLKSNVSHENQPGVLRSFFGYNLFDASTEDVSLFENSSSSVPWLRLVDLAYDLYNQITQASGGQNLLTKNNKNVFLAEVSDDQIVNHDKIKRELQMHGYEVYPKIPLSQKAETIIQQVNDYLSRSSLSIHLIGENPGFLPEGSDVSIVELQNSVAAQYSEKVYNDDRVSNDFTRLLWIPPDIDFENDQQKMEVEQLKQNMSALQGAEVIQTPLEMFKTIIMLRLNETFELADDQESEQAKTRVVYLIYEKAYADGIPPIEAALKESGLEVLHPLFEGDQIELISNHRTNLIDCDATLIYYHDDNTHWIESKIKEQKKSPGFGKKKPFLAKTVLNFEDNEVHDIKLVQENLDIIDVKGDFKAQELAPFLKKLGT